MKHAKILFSSLLIALLCLPMSSLAAGLPKSLNGKATPSLAPVLKQVMPAIVNISAQIQLPNFPRHASPHPPQSRTPRGAHPLAQRLESVGSGVIIDAKNGYIVTNSHVIQHASLITITLADGRHFKARLIGADVPSDVAVLKIDAKNLISLPLGRSDKLQVGDFVMAVGNPYGLNQTVTSGIVSALQRSGLGIEGFENFIQTDASINSGNSGGALVNLQGQLIGINTAILTPDGGNIGIGFAIPSNMVYKVMEQLIKYGNVKRGMLGIVVQTFTPVLAQAFNLDNVKGAVITQITTDSPAERAGLQPYDVIVKIDGDPVKNASDVRNMIGLLRMGSHLTLQVNRGNKPKNITVKIINPKQLVEEIQAKNPLMIGVDMRNFEQQTTAHGRIRGVQVVHIAGDSPASRAQLHSGDVIVEAKHHKILRLSDLEKLIQEHQKTLLLRVLRGNGALFIVLK